MREHPKTKVSVLNAILANQATHNVSRKNVKRLRGQCVSLLKLLDEGLSREPPTSDVLDPVFLRVSQ